MDRTSKEHSVMHSFISQLEAPCPTPLIPFKLFFVFNQQLAVLLSLGKIIVIRGSDRSAFNNKHLEERVFHIFYIFINIFKIFLLIFLYFY